ncbi:MAG: hypothetical protein IAG10_09080, partial [Planctomycetaceae bacterium]|nr:hypothetical protein [Planctomycetaceae bacterium]
LFGKIQTGEPIIRTVRIDNVLVSEIAYSLDDLSEIGQANLFLSEPWYYRGGIEVPVLTVSNGPGNDPETVLAIPPAVTLIAMPSGPIGSAALSDSMNISAMAAQIAQNRANDLARVGTPNFTTNAGLTSLDQGSIQADLANPDAEESSLHERGERSDASAESSSESDVPSFDEFWKEFTQRLRNGNEPMPTDDAAAPNSESPMNPDKAAAKTDAPTTRSATEGRQSTSRSPEMSQRVRPAQRGSTSVFTVKAVTKTAAVKSPMKTQPAR